MTKIDLKYYYMIMKKCNLCSRNCNIDRSRNLGFCNASEKIKISKVMVHHWEEPVISGNKGSGAIFFSNCNLKCVFCQNYQISHEGKGTKICVDDLVHIIKYLENKGVHNINLVTPTHYTDQIIKALTIYKPSIPIVWNTNSYESHSTIEKLKDYIDIFLFDLKYKDDALSQKYSKCKDYFAVATRNILHARKYIKEDIIENNIMKKGIIVRHLVLPNNTNDSIDILNWIKENIPTTLISLMSQYVPCFRASEFPEINSKLKKLEYKRVLTKCQNLGLNGFMQDIESADECFIPDFEEELNLESIIN